MDASDPLAKLELERELEREGAWLRRAAHALTSDPGIAEDAAQAAWIQAWRHRSLKGRAVSRGWLKRVLWNSVRGQVRDDARRSVREQAAAVPEDFNSGDPLQRIELRRMTLDAIESLEEPYRSTIVDRFLDGLSIAEIARRSGSPRKTVETRSRRGVLMLKEALQDRRDSRGVLLLTLLGEVARPLKLAPMARASSEVSRGLPSAGLAASALVAAGVLVWAGARLTSDGAEPSPIARVESSSASVQPGRVATTAQATRVPAQREQAGPDLPQAEDRPAAFALVVDLDGEPVDGVEIAFVDEDENAPPRPSGVRTDASGRASLPAPASDKEVRLVGVAASEALSAVLCPRLLNDHTARIVVAEQMSGDVRLVNTSGEPIVGAVALALIDTDPIERFGVADGL
jgi:RNA polymerase sigma factor (sigma-70 family)